MCNLLKYLTNNAGLYYSAIAVGYMRQHNNWYSRQVGLWLIELFGTYNRMTDFDGQCPIPNVTAVKAHCHILCYTIIVSFAADVYLDF